MAWENRPSRPLPLQIAATGLRGWSMQGPAWCGRRGADEFRDLRRLLRTGRPGRALDPGCGRGRGAGWVQSGARSLRLFARCGLRLCPWLGREWADGRLRMDELIASGMHALWAGRRQASARRDERSCVSAWPGAGPGRLASRPARSGQQRQRHVGAYELWRCGGTRATFTLSVT